MWWIAVAVIQALYIFSGIRVEQRAGMWTWSKFFFSLGFAGVEWLILMATFSWGMTHRHYFALAVTVGSIVAVANFVWFIIAARRWKAPMDVRVFKPIAISGMEDRYRLLSISAILHRLVRTSPFFSNSLF